MALSDFPCLYLPYLYTFPIFFNDMITFSKSNIKTISASKKRVAALWYGDVDRVELFDGSSLTGMAIMATIYTLSGCYQYLILFYSLSGRILEIWSVEPENTVISLAANTERDILLELESRNIAIAPVPTDSPQFNKILMRLPMAFDDDNCTKPLSLFNANPEDSSILLSKEERDLLRKFVICQ